MGFPGFPGWTVQLDPVAVASGRTMLDINSPSTGILIGGPSGGQGVDWGTAAIDAFIASAGQWGSNTVDFTIPNRTVTIALGLGMAIGGPDATTALAALSEKVALIQREGGWLKRQRQGHGALYADVVNASLSVPDVWAETAELEPGVTLTLECLPDFYGDEITLDSVHVSGAGEIVLKQSGVQAVLAGDHPARARIIATETNGNNRRALVWGARSRHYDSAGTAKLILEAEAMTPLDAAGTAFIAGASGSGNNVVQHPSLPGGSWCPVLETDLLSGGALTHQGSYRIWARCYSVNANPQLRLAWAGADLAHPSYNDAVRLPGALAFYLMDFGVVRLDAAPAGSWQWHGLIQAMADEDGDSVAIDCLYLQPLDESAGELVAVQSDSPLAVSKALDWGAHADSGAGGTIAWADRRSFEVLVPQAGPGPGTSNYLKTSAHGFAIPSGAIITGIEVSIVRLAADGHGTVRDSSVRLVRAGTVESVGEHAGSAAWSQNAQVVTYGGQSDLWGAAWTAANVNSATFGAAISATLAGTATAQVDDITIAVFYIGAGSFSPVEDAVMYASRHLEMRSDGMFRENFSGGVYGPVAQVTGDLTRLPASGAEARAVELLVKASRGDLAELPDTGLDPMDVQAIYRPAFLFPF